MDMKLLHISVTTENRVIDLLWTSNEKLISYVMMSGTVMLLPREIGDMTFNTTLVCIWIRKLRVGMNGLLL